jgi:catechol 2,3-dioxygenase
MGGAGGSRPAAGIHPDTRIGHIHLKVSDLQRAVAFYRDVLGFDLVATMGTQAAFLSAGGYHHHIGLNTWSSEGAPPPPKRSTGLYHLAILLPGRRELARMVRRLRDHGVAIEAAQDHGVSEAVYFRDPDGNGIEIYADRDRSQWPRLPDGSFAMVNDSLDLDALLRAFEDSGR